MFKNTYQSGLLSVFYSCGSNPLSIWESEVHNGHIKRLTDSEVNSVVLEIVSTNVATTFISCPKNKQVLGIRLPFLVMIVKNLKRYFSFEITILDDKGMRRRFRISNFQSTTKIKPFCTTMPIGLSGGWNQIQFNLSDFTKRAYGTQFLETLRVQVHANVRLRRIYFADRLYTEEELPQDYKLYLPMERKKKKEGKKEEKKEEAKPTEVVALPPPPPLAPPAEEPPPIETEPRPSIVSRKSIAKTETLEEAPAAEPPAEGGEVEPAEGGEAVAETAVKEEPPAEVSEEAPAGGEAPPDAPAGETGTPVEAPTEAPAEASPSEAPPAEAPPAEAPPAEEAPSEAAAEAPADTPGDAPAE